MLRALSTVRHGLFSCVRTLSAQAGATTEAPAAAPAAAAAAESAAPAEEVEVESAEGTSSGRPQIVKKEYSEETFKVLKLDQYPYYVEREWWKRGKRMTFWATWRQLRDVKRRETVQETGADRMRLKAIKFNTILPQAIRDAAAEEMSSMPKYSHPRLVLNMCQFTGRQRGKIKPYRLNRHLFRKFADHSQLSGVQRAMW